MAKYQLIIVNDSLPIRSETEQNTFIRTLVVHWTGAWAPNDHPEHYLVVEPGDELEVVLSARKSQGGSLWIYDNGIPLLEPVEGIERQGNSERIDFESESQGQSRSFRLNPSLARVSGEVRYNVRTSPLRQQPPPFVGEGQAGSLTASKP